VIDYVKVLHPIQHKIGHFRDVSQANLLAWYRKAKPNSLTQQKHTFTNQKKCTATHHKHQKIHLGLVASYDIRQGNGDGLFWFWHFINLSLTYLPRHLPTYLQARDPHGANLNNKQLLV